MKETLKKISSVMKTIFGWGMLISLAVGTLMFFGYVAALIIGGDIAAAICYFLYKQLAPVLIYATSILMLFGLVAMYLGGEAALSGGKKNAPKGKDTAPEKENDAPEAKSDAAGTFDDGLHDDAPEAGEASDEANEPK